MSAPTPRPHTWLDRLIGPGATSAEIALQLAGAVLAGGAMLAYAWLAPLPWSGWQVALATLLACDMGGGVVTNASPSAKRWYHRPGYSPWARVGFVAVHGLHLLLVAGVFRSGDWAWAAAWYALLMVFSVTLARSPRAWHGPLAMLWVMVGIGLNLYAFGPTLGLEWFIPVFLIKLLLGHMVGPESD